MPATAAQPKTIRRNTKEFATMFDGKTKAVVVLGDLHGTVCTIDQVRYALSKDKKAYVTRDADSSLYVRCQNISWTVS